MKIITTKKASPSSTSLFLSNHCYELLLAALLLHLYGSLFFIDLLFYGKYVRVANTFLLYFSVTNSLFHRRKKMSSAVIVAVILTLLLNLILLAFSDSTTAKEARDFLYLIFLFFSLYYTCVFIISPHRLDKALISASISGYLLIIGVAARVFIILYAQDGKQVLTNIDFSYHTKTFIDTVYFCTITITSIGYGDILPLSHNAKIAASLLGLTGQFYLVVVMGIIVSKFISAKQTNSLNT